MHYTQNRVLCHIIFGQEQDFQDEERVRQPNFPSGRVARTLVAIATKRFSSRGKPSRHS